MKSLNKSLDILELFLSSQEEVQLTDLAKLSGLKKSTVKHIVSVLVARGYLKQREKRGKYSLGTKFLDFSSLIKRRIKIRDEALPHLIKLARLTKESVALTVLEGQSAKHQEVIPSDQDLRVVPNEVIKVPLYCTGMGKIFLADMTEAEVENYINSIKLEAYTANTITHPDYLKAQIAIIAREGVAYDDEECFPGIRNVAAGIKDNEGKTVAAVGVIAPSLRLTRDRMTEIAPDVKNCASEISRELGYEE